MKKLLVFLFSLFFLSTPSAFADDISDFQIEGISIGDSLLDYMTEEEILKEIEVNKDNYSYLKESNKLSPILFPSILRSEISYAKTKGELRRNIENRRVSSFFIVESFLNYELILLLKLIKKYSI